MTGSETNIMSTWMMMGGDVGRSHS